MIACLSSILWGLRLPIVLLQSKRLTRPVVYQTRCFCINVGNATEQILANGRHIGAAIDAHICAESPSCNGVCCIVGQATHAAQEQWSLICVTWTMLYSVSFLSTALLNETEAFASTVLLMFLLRVAAMLQSRLTIAAGAWQQHRATTTDLRTPRQTSPCSTSTAELYYLRHCRSCAATASGNKGGNPGQSHLLVISGAVFLGSMLQQMCITLLSPIYKLVHCTWRMGQRVTKSMMKQIVNFFAMLQSAMMKQIVNFFAMLQSALELAQEVASAWLSPLELAACLHLASFDIHLSLHSVHCEPDHCWCSVLTETTPRDVHHCDGSDLTPACVIGLARPTNYMSHLDRYVYACIATGGSMDCHGVVVADFRQKTTRPKQRAREAVGYYNESCYRADWRHLNDSRHGEQ